MKHQLWLSIVFRNICCGVLVRQCSCHNEPHLKRLSISFNYNVLRHVIKGRPYPKNTNVCCCNTVSTLRWCNVFLVPIPWKILPARSIGALVEGSRPFLGDAKPPRHPRQRRWRLGQERPGPSAERPEGRPQGPPRLAPQPGLQRRERRLESPDFPSGRAGAIHVVGEHLGGRQHIGLAGRGFVSPRFSLPGHQLGDGGRMRVVPSRKLRSPLQLTPPSSGPPPAENSSPRSQPPPGGGRQSGPDPPLYARVGPCAIFSAISSSHSRR